MPGKQSVLEREWITVGEMIGRFGMARRTVYRLIEQGQFPSAFRGDGTKSGWRIPVEEVEDYVRRQQMKRGLDETLSRPA